MSFLVHACHHKPPPLIQNNNVVIPDHNNPFHSCGNPCLFHSTALPSSIARPFFLSFLHFIFSPSLHLFACCSIFHLSWHVHLPLQVSVNLWLKVSLLSLNHLEQDSDKLTQDGILYGHFSMFRVKMI